MSSSNPTNEQRQVIYLTRMLQKNPAEESGSIIRARSRALGLAKKTKEQTTSVIDPSERQRQREFLLERVAKIRQNIWNTKPEPLNQEFAKLNAENFPDIQATVNRLKTILNHRNQLPALSQHPDFDGDFFSVFKQVLSSPPREIAVLKEQVLVSFGKGKMRRRGKKMIKLMKQELPEVYSLEATWLDSLARQKKGVLSKSPFLPIKEGRDFPWWLIILAIIAFRMIRVYMRTK